MTAIELGEFERNLVAHFREHPEFAAQFLEDLTTRPLPEQLIVLRRLMGWTQARLAKELGLKQTHISRLEKLDSDHRTRLYRKAAEAFGARLAFIPRGVKLVAGPGFHSVVAEPARPYRVKRKRGPR